MKVTIDEARVGKQPILKIDGIELAPLLENTELLRAYTGLMVGG